MSSAVQTSSSSNTQQINNNGSEQHIEDNTNNTVPLQQSSSQISSSGPNIDDTAMVEYLELVQTEYQIERGKKDSFENRAGIIMAFVGALLVFVMDKVPLNDILALCKSPLTFVILVKIIMGIASYATLIFSLFFSFFTITTRKQENYPISEINLSYLAESRRDAIARITLKYKDIIINHRNHNEKRAYRFKISLVLSVVSICCFMIYSLMK